MTWARFNLQWSWENKHLWNCNPINCFQLVWRWYFLQRQKHPTFPNANSQVKLEQKAAESAGQRRCRSRGPGMWSPNQKTFQKVMLIRWSGGCLGVQCFVCIFPPLWNQFLGKGIGYFILVPCLKPTRTVLNLFHVFFACVCAWWKIKYYHPK